MSIDTHKNGLCPKGSSILLTKKINGINHILLKIGKVDYMTLLQMKVVYHVNLLHYYSMENLCIKKMQLRYCVITLQILKMDQLIRINEGKRIYFQ